MGTTDKENRSPTDIGSDVCVLSSAQTPDRAKLSRLVPDIFRDGQLSGVVQEGSRFNRLNQLFVIDSMHLAKPTA
jgi:hypothetical protein